MLLSDQPKMPPSCSAQRYPCSSSGPSHLSSRFRSRTRLLPRSSSDSLSSIMRSVMINLGLMRLACLCSLDEHLIGIAVEDHDSANRDRRRQVREDMRLEQFDVGLVFILSDLEPDLECVHDELEGVRLHSSVP